MYTTLVGSLHCSPVCSIYHLHDLQFIWIFSFSAPLDDGGCVFLPCISLISLFSLACSPSALTPSLHFFLTYSFQLMHTQDFGFDLDEDFMAKMPPPPAPPTSITNGGDGDGPCEAAALRTESTSSRKCRSWTIVTLIERIPLEHCIDGNISPRDCLELYGQSSIITQRCV